MVKSHRLPEPRLAAFARSILAEVCRWSYACSCSPACARGFARRFFVAVRVRLRPVSLIARPPDLPAPLRLRAAPVTVSQLTILLKLLSAPARWCADRPERVFLDPIFRRVLPTRFPRTNRSCSQENRSAEFRYHPFAAGAFHDRGASAAGFGPLTDFVVVGGASGLASTGHESPSSVDFFWADSFVAVPAEL